MSSNLRVNSIIPSVGTNVAIGTANGSITFPANVSFSGISTIGISTAYIGSINDGPLSGARNIVINGAMDINQRGFTGVAGTTTSGSFPVDRFFIGHLHDGVVSAGQTGMGTTTGGNAYADGFQNALYFTVTTADASLAANQYQLIQHRIEGFNVQGIKKGTVNALPVTLSFWVRSTTTGTYIAELEDTDNNFRQVSQAYTINAANTWEKKILTFPADTIGTLANNNGSSLRVSWWLAAGSNFSSGTLNTSWATLVQGNRAAGQTNLLATAGNNFWLTGVQLEVGSQATPFERRSYGQELALCQRYYERSDGSLSGESMTGYSYYPLNGTGSITTPREGTPNFFAVQKRASATVTVYAYNGTSGAVTPVIDGSTDSGIAVRGDTKRFNVYASTYRSLNVWFGWTASAEL